MKVRVLSVIGTKKTPSRYLARLKSQSNQVVSCFMCLIVLNSSRQTF